MKDVPQALAPEHPVQLLHGETVVGVVAGDGGVQPGGRREPQRVGVGVEVVVDGARVEGVGLRPVLAGGELAPSRSRSAGRTTPPGRAAGRPP